MSQFDDLKERVYQANMELPRLGVVIHNFGNVSAVDRQRGIFAIKPSGVLYSVLKPQDIVIVDLECRVVEGTMNPSSDTKTHAVLYRHFPNIGGVVHTHSPFAVAWAQAQRPIPVYGTTHADHLHVDIPVTKMMSDEAIQGDYEVETGMQIVRRFADLSPDEVQMVLVAGHGPFAWGTTPEKAVYHAVIVEELAKMALYTEQVRGDVPRLKESLIQKHYLRKHGPGAYYGQRG
ncbi:MAG: L-ribulose-5-phosphate 4-epimerase [Calditrichaeota bacterium]|nr:MAG: L-ribulose-5-phosphate 4-epimerase [Calditrichota bacterium]